MASLVSSFIKSTVSRVVGPGKDLPNVSIGPKDTEWMNINNMGIWTNVYQGNLRDEINTPVTIFHFDITQNRERSVLANNYFKRVKTIRHPNCIKFIDGVMTDSNIYIVTDRVTQCSFKTDHRLITLGIYKIATALQFLHNDCKLVHGNVTSKSIVVTQSGEWQLSGFELTSSISDPNGLFFTHKHFLPNTTMPVDISRNPISTDLYMLGSLIQASIPATAPDANDLHQYMHQFMTVNPSMDCTRFLNASSFTNNHLVNVCSSIENMAVLDERERNVLIEKVAVAVDEFPIQFNTFKILPILLKALEHGTVSPKTLAPIFKIATNLSDQEFRTLLNPSLTKLFTLTDRAIRLALLEVLPIFVNRLEKRMVDKLFPNIALGFVDTTPIIREYTVRSMILLVPVMSSSVCNNDVLRFLGKAQTDTEPSIRTNATVCLSKIASYLSSSMRNKVLIPGLTRALQDTFPPARVAALNGLVQCSEYFSGLDLACKVLPSVSPLLLDPELVAREIAINLVKSMMERIEKCASQLPESAYSSSSSNGGNLVAMDQAKDMQAAMNVAMGKSEYVSQLPGSGSIFAAAASVSPSSRPGTPKLMLAGNSFTRQPVQTNNKEPTRALDAIDKIPLDLNNAWDAWDNSNTSLTPSSNHVSDSSGMNFNNTQSSVLPTQPTGIQCKQSLDDLFSTTFKKPVNQNPAAALPQWSLPPPPPPSSGSLTHTGLTSSSATSSLSPFQNNQSTNVWAAAFGQPSGNAKNNILSSGSAAFSSSPFMNSTTKTLNTLAAPLVPIPPKLSGNAATSSNVLNEASSDWGDDWSN